MFAYFVLPSGILKNKVQTSIKKKIYKVELSQKLGVVK